MLASPGILFTECTHREVCIVVYHKYLSVSCMENHGVSFEHLGRRYLE